MSDSKPRSNSNYSGKSYTQNTSVKITKGFQKDCQGKISGCTSDGVYFVRIDKCERESDRLRSPIELYLPGEFELLD